MEKLSYDELREQLDFQIYLLDETQSLSKIGSWNWDVVNDKVEWSKMMFQLLGLQPDELPPSYELALSHVHDDDKKQYEFALGESLTNKTTYYFENRIVTKNKSVVPVVSRGQCHLDEKGNLLRMIGTVQDISEEIKNRKIVNQAKKAVKDILEKL